MSIQPPAGQLFVVRRAQALGGDLSKRLMRMLRTIPLENLEFSLLFGKRLFRNKNIRARQNIYADPMQFSGRSISMSVR